MSQLLTIALAGFGLAGLIVIPVNGPTAAIRERAIVPAWDLARRVLTRLPAKGPHDCVLCMTPYATAVCWAIDGFRDGFSGLLLATFAAGGLAAGVMVMAGWTASSPARARSKKGCSTCGAEGKQGAVEGSSTTAQ